MFHLPMLRALGALTGLFLFGACSDGAPPLGPELPYPSAFNSVTEVPHGTPLSNRRMGPGTPMAPAHLFRTPWTASGSWTSISICPGRRGSEPGDPVSGVIK